MDLIDRLYQVLNEAPMSPKVLLAKSYAQGHQLLELVCKRYGALFNVEVQTLHGVAAAHTKLERFRAKIRLLDEGQAVWVTRQLMKQLAERDPNSYITDAMLKPGVVDQVHRAILELRNAGICADNMQIEPFTNSNKGKYLQRLLAQYETYLQEHYLTDVAGVAENVKPLLDDTVFLAFEPISWTQTEQLVIERLAGNRLHILEPDVPFYTNEQFAQNKFSIFRATGSLAEVREGFRRILAEPIALDRTEIILSNYEQYVPLLFSHCESMGIACTLSNGLPSSYCAAGEAVVHILNWMEENYPVMTLTAMLRHGQITFPDDRWSHSDWIRELENSGIGWGRERYTELFLPGRLNVEGREPASAIWEAVKDWFKGLPEGKDWNAIQLLGWVCDFVRKYVPSRSQDDANFVSALQEMANRYCECPADTMPRELAIHYVREMLSEVRIRISATPKPGALHISSLSDGGWSGRERTWIVGMDERAWSVTTMQDPLLLDHERSALSGSLASTQLRAKRIRQEREQRLSQIRGEVWLSYSSYDIGEQRSQGPAFEMLQVHRLQKGDSTIDFGELEQSLGEPYSVMDMMHVSELPVPLDGMDAWAGLLQGTRGNRKDGWQVMLQAYPALAQGSQAQLQRMDERLTAFDGWLDIDLDSYLEEDRRSDVVSVSQLEKYASCGLQYYFHYVLKLRPKEAAKFDRTRWLQANERGTLLHDVFRRYLEEVTERGTCPPKHDRDRLFTIVDLFISEIALTIPSPSEHVLAKECEEIRRDVEIFYRNERDSLDQPCFFELELTGHNGEPMRVELTGGMIIKLKGTVDRIDRIAPHEYRIIDYKTGSTNKYKPSEYFSGGTQLQHALYAVAVEQWLRETGIDPAARVVEAEYYFPSERGRGERVRRIQNRREELAAIVAKLIEARNRGLYVPAKDARMCQWCHYQAGCGSHSEWMAGKRDSTANVELMSMLLEVEGIG